MLEVALLGPVEARRHGVRVSVSPLERSLLAVLALAQGAVVSTEKIIDCMWGETPPASPRSRVQGLISSLRRKVGDALVTRYPGYLLKVDPRALDLTRCEDLARQARNAPTPREAADRLREALALWRGEPLDGISAPGIDVDRARLTEMRVRMLEERFDAELELGNHAELVAELAATVSVHPLHERLTGQLMLALYRCNRQADALAVYQALRSRIADELGGDPCAELRNLYTAILRGDQVRQSPAKPAGLGCRPAQLPAGVGYFTGRGEELTAMRRAVAKPGEDARVLVVTGLGGLGKTALVVHWAHSVADRFPDGQVFVDLRGHDPSQAMTAEAVLSAVLLALGLPKNQLPDAAEERIGLYRSRIADRRLLIVADNARSVEQLLPLVPPAPECMLVATSRRRLTSLAAYHDLRAVTVEPLPPRASYELLTRIVGPERLEDPATAEVIELCGGSPLAIRLAGAKLLARPRQTMASLIEDLRDPIDGWTLDDDERTVHTALVSAYQNLSPAAARLFGQLGLHPGPVDVHQLGIPALPLPARRLRQLVDELVTTHLVVETGPGCYTVADLARAFARRCGEDIGREPAGAVVSRPGTEFRLGRPGGLRRGGHWSDAPLHGEDLHPRSAEVALT